MKATDVLAAMLEKNLGVVKMTLADFTDEEMMVRPAPQSNHPMWTLAHLAISEHYLIGQHNPNMPPLPEGFRDRYYGEAKESDQLSDFPGKQALLDLFETIRLATIAWVRGLPPERLSDENKALGHIFPQVHDIIAMQSMHATMHLGQWQVVRRKLGKPVLM